jgi:hypothetical protein
MRRKAQAPPMDPLGGGGMDMGAMGGGGMDPMAMGGGGMDMGAMGAMGGMDPMAMGGGMGAAPMAMGAPPAGGEAMAEPTIVRPLSAPHDILVDCKALDRLGRGTHVDDLVAEIWEEYGGSKLGGVNNSRKGKRDPKKKPIPEAEIEQEHVQTEDKKWERLPLGKTIADVFKGGQDELRETLVGNLLSLNQSVGGGAAGGGGAPGGMPMASIIKKRLALAANYDRKGLHTLADGLDLYCKKLLKLRMRNRR